VRYEEFQATNTLSVPALYSGSIGEVMVSVGAKESVKVPVKDVAMAGVVLVAGVAAKAPTVSMME